MVNFLVISVLGEVFEYFIFDGDFFGEIAMRIPNAQKVCAGQKIYDENADKKYPSF